MQKDIFEKIISFLLGASWAFMLFGAFVVFQVFLKFGFTLSLFFTISFIFSFLFIIVILDTFVVNKQKLDESKKQTEILEKIFQHLQQDIEK